MLRRWRMALHVVWIEPCFPPSTGFRSQNWFCVRIWRNMSRAASLMLRRGPCGYFIELCAAADMMLALSAAIATLVLSRWDTLVWLPNCCSPLHWSQILDRIRLEGPKKCWRSCCVHDGFMMAWPCDHRFPRYDCFEGTWSRKMKFSLFSKFYLNRPQMRANVFYSSGKDLNNSAVIFVHYKTRHVLSTRQLERP